MSKYSATMRAVTGDQPVGTVEPIVQNAAVVLDDLPRGHVVVWIRLMNYCGVMRTRPWRVRVLKEAEYVCPSVVAGD